MAAPEAAREREGDIDWKRVAAQRVHPLQLAILEAMADGERHAPIDLARELGERLEKVAYHVSELEKALLIELSGTESRRGATKHFYRSRC